MRDMVLGQADRPQIMLTQERIHRDSAFNVTTMDQQKVYRPIFRKGWIDACLNVFPYGYVRAKQTVHSAATYVHNLFTR